MPAERKPPDKPKPLRYSLARLAEKPLVIPTCQGDVVISSEHLPGKQRVTVKLPKCQSDIDISSGG